MIFHMCPKTEWEKALETGLYEGNEVDRKDGFIHFSTGEQLRETARLHRRGVEGLVLICVDPETLGDALKWEPSRGGRMFPHLYGPLPVRFCVSVHDLPVGEDGVHEFPAFVP